MAEPLVLDPADPLKNNRHENFCIEMALGAGDPATAYLKSFETDSHANAQKAAYRLMKRPEIDARIDWLRRDRVERRMKQVNVSAEWVLEEFVRQYYLCDAERNRRGCAAFLKMIAIEQGMLVLRREVIHGKMDRLEGSWEEIQNALAGRIARLFPGRRPEDIISLLRAARSGRGLEGDRTTGVLEIRPVPEAADVSQPRHEPPRALPHGGEPGGEDSRGGDGDGVPPDGDLP
jgi:hypothetical protein